MAAYSPYNIKAGLGLNLNNLVTFNKVMGLGVNLDVAYSPYMKASEGWGTAWEHAKKLKFPDLFDTFDHALDASLAVMLNMHSTKVAFDLGVGGFFIWGPEFANDAGDNMLFGPLAKASLAYRFNETVSLGVSGKFGIAFSANNYKPSRICRSWKAISLLDSPSNRRHENNRIQSRDCGLCSVRGAPVMTTIAFFDTKAYDRPHFDALAPQMGVSITYFESAQRTDRLPCPWLRCGLCVRQ